MPEYANRPPGRSIREYTGGVRRLRVTEEYNNGKDNGDGSKIKTGFAIAPVPLNLKGKNRALVGLGSYLVNATGDCNGCHTQSAQSEYSPGGISRNLTPDKTGKPEGGNSFEDFVKIMRTGTDLDGWHPTCSPTSGPHCIPPPFDGSLLQVMPWPTYQNVTDHDLRAIYEYLSAIPCIGAIPATRRAPTQTATAANSEVP